MPITSNNLIDRIRRDIERCEFRLWWMNIGLALLTVAAMLASVFMGDIIHRWGK